MLQHFDGNDYDTSDVLERLRKRRRGISMRAIFRWAYRAYHSAPKNLCEAARQRIDADLQDYEDTGVLLSYVLSAFVNKPNE